MQCDLRRRVSNVQSGLTSSRHCALERGFALPSGAMPISRLFISWNLSGRHIAMADLICPACRVTRTCRCVHTCMQIRCRFQRQHMNSAERQIVAATPSMEACGRILRSRGANKPMYGSRSTRAGEGDFDVLDLPTRCLAGRGLCVVVGLEQARRHGVDVALPQLRELLLCQVGRLRCHPSDFLGVASKTAASARP